MRECDPGMAREGVTVIVISSSSSSSSSSSEEDEEAAYERSQKLKLREACRLFDCTGWNGGGQEEDDDDDCVILEKDPFAEEDAKTIADFSSKLSLSSRGGGGGGGKDGSSQPQAQHQEDGDENENEVSIVAERGKVALRDYPHSRHLCVKLPFGKTPHESYCNQCYCYVCDKPAPCEKWKGNSQGHCNATDQADEWKKLRKANKLRTSSQEVGS